MHQSILFSHLFKIAIIPARVPGHYGDIFVHGRAEEVKLRLGEDARVEQAQGRLGAHVQLVVSGWSVVEPHHRVVTVCVGGQEGVRPVIRYSGI